MYFVNLFLFVGEVKKVSFFVFLFEATEASVASVCFRGGVKMFVYCVIVFLIVMGVVNGLVSDVGVLFGFIKWKILLMLSFSVLVTRFVTFLSFFVNTFKWLFVLYCMFEFEILNFM